MEQKKEFEIKQYYKSDLAKLYGFSLRTLKRIVKELSNDNECNISVTRKHYFTPIEVKIIVDNIGSPYGMKLEE